MQDGTIGHVTHDGPYSLGGLPLVLGEDITVGHGAILHACTVGDRCLIGMGSLILDGAVIEDDVMPGRRQPGQPGQATGIGLALPRPPCRTGTQAVRKGTGNAPLLSRPLRTSQGSVFERKRVKGSG